MRYVKGDPATFAAIWAVPVGAATDRERAAGRVRSRGVFRLPRGRHAGNLMHARGRLSGATLSVTSGRSTRIIMRPITIRQEIYFLDLFFRIMHERRPIHVSRRAATRSRTRPTPARHRLLEEARASRRDGRRARFHETRSNATTDVEARSGRAHRRRRPSRKSFLKSV